MHLLPIYYKQNEVALFSTGDKFGFMSQNSPMTRYYFMTYKKKPRSHVALRNTIKPAIYIENKIYVKK